MRGKRGPAQGSDSREGQLNWRVISKEESTRLNDQLEVRFKRAEEVKSSNRPLKWQNC